MSRKNVQKAVFLFTAFAGWTTAVLCLDRQAIGPLGSVVGLATCNRAVQILVGVNPVLYAVTDWLGLVPIAVMFGFALLGLWQWIRRRSLRQVDRSLLVLGGLYLALLVAYLLFESFVINCRPVLIEGVLEASYPSSTTLLALCVLPTAKMQLRDRIRHPAVGRVVLAACTLLLAVLLVGRFLSGVHWMSDLVGGGLLGGALVCFYRAAVDVKTS